MKVDYGVPLLLKHGGNGAIAGDVPPVSVEAVVEAQADFPALLLAAAVPAPDEIPV